MPMDPRIYASMRKFYLDRGIPLPPALAAPAQGGMLAPGFAPADEEPMNAGPSAFPDDESLRRAFERARFSTAAGQTLVPEVPANLMESVPEALKRVYGAAPGLPPQRAVIGPISPSNAANINAMRRFSGMGPLAADYERMTPRERFLEEAINRRAAAQRMLAEGNVHPVRPFGEAFDARKEARRFVFGLGPESGLGPARNDAGAPAPQLFAGVGPSPEELRWQKQVADVNARGAALRLAMANRQRTTPLIESNKEKMAARKLLLARARAGEGPALSAEASKVSPATLRYAQGIADQVPTSKDLADRIVAARTKGLWRGAYREAARGNMGPLQDMQMERATKMFGENGGSDGMLNPAKMAAMFGPGVIPSVLDHNAKRAAADAELAHWKNLEDAETKKLRATIVSGLLPKDRNPTKTELDRANATADQIIGATTGADRSPPDNQNSGAANPPVKLSESQSMIDAAVVHPGVRAMGISAESSLDHIGRALWERVLRNQPLDQETLNELANLVKARYAKDPNLENDFYVPGMIDALATPAPNTWAAIVKAHDDYLKTRRASAAPPPF